MFWCVAFVSAKVPRMCFLVSIPLCGVWVSWIAMMDISCLVMYCCISSRVAACLHPHMLSVAILYGYLCVNVGEVWSS